MILPRWELASQQWTLSPGSQSTRHVEQVLTVVIVTTIIIIFTVIIIWVLSGSNNWVYMPYMYYQPDTHQFFVSFPRLKILNIRSLNIRTFALRKF